MSEIEHQRARNLLKHTVLLEDETTGCTYILFADPGKYQASKIFLTQDNDIAKEVASPRIKSEIEAQGLFALEIQNSALFDEMKISWLSKATGGGAIKNEEDMVDYIAANINISGIDMSLASDDLEHKPRIFFESLKNAIDSLIQFARANEADQSFRL